MYMICIENEKQSYMKWGDSFVQLHTPCMLSLKFCDDFLTKHSRKSFLAFSIFSLKNSHLSAIMIQIVVINYVGHHSYHVKNDAMEMTH